MSRERQAVLILYAEDDPEDRTLFQEAMHESRLVNELHMVRDGEELMDYLNRRGGYAKLSGQPLPGLILLDLNMPRKDGREAAREIKSDKRFRHIPLVVLTTSDAEEDIIRSYDLGVNSFIRKPVTFDQLVDYVRTLGEYWLQIVNLPIRVGSSS